MNRRMKKKRADRQKLYNDLMQGLEEAIIYTKTQNDVVKVLDDKPLIVATVNDDQLHTLRVEKTDAMVTYTQMFAQIGGHDE